MKHQAEARVTNLEELQQAIAKVKAAQQKYATFTQEQVDHIFREVAIAANNARIELAKMAVEETGMGLVEDKVSKFLEKEMYFTLSSLLDSFFKISNVLSFEPSFTKIISKS